ncbi:hypothetical protein CDV55_101231 [Aspergillus turcosus]|uniref:Protein kinase domain-containing protein n=1 Tax=Aspergillus turcosus TaxID=1245748 RepID=A0A229XNJ3_9EURO|nr:hypothetical protein CDV55_101231 [Aspergillus turcosus]RLM00068.1 hypothetical protein CFD26_104789 [Aspergillus turcosus]
MSSPLFRIGQILRGKLGKYTIAKQVRDTVWLANNQAEETVIIKGVQGHPRVTNERDVLKRFQSRTSCLRPLIDEIEDPSEPTTIVLKYLEDDLLQATKKQHLNRKELKHVSRYVLEALNSLHEGGYVHADVKPDNVFVNYIDRGVKNNVRFSDVQLGDLGGACHVDSKWAKSGAPLGAPMWRSPEMIMETPWGTPTDIWSFGAVLISLIYGGDFNLFDPTTVPYGHEEYSLEVLKQQFRYFGPWPGKYEEVASPETVHAIMWIMQEIPKSETTPFSMITENEVCKKDKEFIMGIMKMDWRDRPTAKDLLGHEWFNEDCEE